MRLTCLIGHGPGVCEECGGPLHLPKAPKIKQKDPGRVPNKIPGVGAAVKRSMHLHYIWCKGHRTTNCYHEISTCFLVSYQNCVEELDGVVPDTEKKTYAKVA